VIDERVLSIITMRAPRANDLRLVVTAARVASDLERVGDYARNIAKRTSAVMGGAGDAKMPWDALIEIGTLVASMIDDVLDAYQQGDIEAAQAIRNSDIHVDKLNTGFMKSVIKMMEDDKVSALDGTHLIFMSKNLERIGDYTTSIAEQIHFIETGTQPDDERPKADGSSVLSSL
jgi:phosphate transport system protein